jgi:outer membrane protein TolC
LTANSNAGGSTGGGPNAGINSLVNGVNQTNSAMLTLTIPIDDHGAKVALASAKIALREATLGLQQQKWAKETSAINTWNSIFSAKRSLEFAEQAEKLQDKTYQINFQKYSHGLIDSMELQTAQQQYVSSQQAMESARMGYLKALIEMDQMMGNTLITWNVKVRYD